MWKLSWGVLGCPGVSVGCPFPAGAAILAAKENKENDKVRKTQTWRIHAAAKREERKGVAKESRRGRRGRENRKTNGR